MAQPGFQKLGDLFDKQKETKKTTAHEWQELALRVVNELSIPNYKRSAVFRVCKVYPKSFIEMCLNDTKELCETGDKWKYFFKIVSQK